MEEDMAKMYNSLQLPFKVLGLNVLDPQWKFSPLTLFTIVCFVVQHYSSVEFFFTHLHTFDVLTECVSVSSTGLAIAIRMSQLFLHRGMLLDTIESVRNQSGLFRTNDIFRQLNGEFYRRAYFTVRIVGYIYLTTMMFELIPIVSPDPKKKNLPLALFLPIMPPDVAPYWHVNYAFHTLINWMAVCFLVGVDSALAVSTLAAVYQIKGLKQCLRELDTGTERGPLHAELVSILRTHISVKKFTRQLEDMYAFDLLVIFCSVCLIICMGLNVVATDVWHPISFFLMAATFQLFLICYYGNLLLIESDTLADCVYSIDWISMPVPEQRLVLIMIAHAQPTLELNGIFMPLAMSSFMSIMKASYSYFTLLH